MNTSDNEISIIKDTSFRKIILSLLLFLIIVYYLILLFWNIPYPLFWSDEAMTVMHSERVLKYGYPKVSDGKNVLYDLLNNDADIGRDKKTDAFIGGSGWLHYYFAAPFVLIADGFKDFYVKTAIIRAPFAVIGTFGLLLFIFSLLPLFKNSIEKLLSSIIFALLCVFSVPVLLHLREVRYYSLTFFLFGAMIYFFSYHRIYGRFSKYKYCTALTLILLFLFFTFSPAYFISLGILGLFEVLNFLFWYYYERNFASADQSVQLRKKILESIFYLLPLILSLIILIPFFVFFKTFQMHSTNANFDNFSINQYISNLRLVVGFFLKYELLLPALIMKLFIIIKTSKMLEIKIPYLIKHIKLSYCYLIFIAVYIILICSIDYFPFNRYYIYIQPLISLMLILDFYLIIIYIRNYYYSKKIKFITLFTIISCCIFLFHIVRNFNLIEGKLYETFHRFENTIDYSVKFIADNFEKPDTLIIATNYEEACYDYYLGCKTIIGYVGNNLKEDLKLNPDIIIVRRNFIKIPLDFLSIANYYIQQAAYQKIILPCYDDKFNTIPEIRKDIHHSFRSPRAKKDEERLKVYIRIELLKNKKLKL